MKKAVRPQRRQWKRKMEGRPRIAGLLVSKEDVNDGVQTLATTRGESKDTIPRDKYYRATLVAKDSLQRRHQDVCER